MKAFNFRWRLTLWYGAVMTMLVVVFSVAVYGFMRQSLLARADFELQEELEEISVEVALANNETELAEQLHDRFFDHGSFNFQISTTEGRILFVSRRLKQTSLPLSTRDSRQFPRFETASFGELGNIRIGRIESSGLGGRILVQSSTSVDPIYTELNSLAATLVSVGLIVIATALIGGYLLARKSLAPVRRMASIAERISAARLSDRLDVANVDDELGQLAITLNTMIDRLQQAIEEMRRFTADAAHELRTPLAVIQTEAEVALRTDRSTDEYRQVVEVTLNESRRLTRMADQLLLLCRHDAGLHSLPKEEVPLDALMRDVVEQLRSTADKKSIRLEVATSEPCVVFGDDIQLSRVLHNVLENAIKYTPLYGNILASITHDDRHAIVTIKDTGKGINAADIPHIFERFYRADASRTRNGTVGGAGLGLAISKAIIDSHGGTIRVQSDVGTGTTVVLTLALFV